MPTGNVVKAALYEGKALRQQAAEVRKAAVQRAVANVLDGSCESCEDAARGWGVPVHSVRAAMRAAKKARGER